MAWQGISEQGNKRAAFYSREVADVCLNCKRPDIGRECSENGCPAYRAAMRRVAEKRRNERLKSLAELEEQRGAM